ncbi:MAG: hypothetical protein ABFC77_07785 [Thermoguttaceae bacterium]
MPIADRQILGELVDCADIAVRAAGQLQLFMIGKPIRDRQVLERVAEFLSAAEAGGIFMSCGDSANLHASLRPLNWAVDTRMNEGGLEQGEFKETDYQSLTEYLRRMRSTVEDLLEGNRPNNAAIEECMRFFDSLGDDLGTRADQHVRGTSLPCSSLASF